MLCRECWIYRQKKEQTEQNLSNLEVGLKRVFLRGKKSKGDPVKIAKCNELIDKQREILNCSLQKLLPIGDKECAMGRCILCDV